MLIRHHKALPKGTGSPHANSETPVSYPAIICSGLRCSWYLNLPLGLCFDQLCRCWSPPECCCAQLSGCSSLAVAATRACPAAWLCSLAVNWDCQDRAPKPKRREERGAQHDSAHRGGRLSRLPMNSPCITHLFSSIQIREVPTHLTKCSRSNACSEHRNRRSPLNARHVEA